MFSKLVVNPNAFAAIQRVDATELSKLSEQDIRPLLPCLVRMSLISPMDQSKSWAASRKTILRILSGIELVNSLVALLSIDFHALEVDVRKEQQLRQKIGGLQSEGILVQGLQNGLSLEFERSDPAKKLRLFLSELLCIQAQLKESQQQLQQEFFIRPSDLFDSEVYLEEVSDVMCIAQAELPALLPAHEIAEALLHVKHGAWLICRLVANAPDTFKEVCIALIMAGEKQDEETVGGQIRMRALRTLSQINPSQALVIRSKAVEHCRMPGLAVALTLDHCKQEQPAEASLDASLGDAVAFVSGLLLGSDSNIRAWFAQYIRNGQKKRDTSSSTLHALREELLQRLQNIVLFSLDQQNLPDSKVVQASALLRLYCALKGIAGFKFNEDEVNLLLQLLTSHPPPSPAGVRFVSLSLCMLLACPSLIGTPELEKKAITWLDWLVKEEAYFERTSGVKASFGEMLLLIAIHFHSNQLNAISDLICSTLAMKIPIRPSSIARMKTIFTQEVFTEQVVTTHAVKVQVTPSLSANVVGFLPIHCIHQLLKSRAFTKHKVPINDWIFKQICNATIPLHPVLPPLIEAYVNSILVPATKGQHDATNEPLAEEEIHQVFHMSVFLEPSRCGKSSRIGKPIHSRPSSAVPSRSSSPIPADQEILPSMTSQLLLLYYLLLYEDTRLANMRAIVSTNRKVKRYSPNLMAELPIKFLLQQAQRNQQQFAGLFAPLLRLLVTHYPHLCLIEDWLYDDTQASTALGLIISQPASRLPPTPSKIEEAFDSLGASSAKAVSLLRQLLSLSAPELWPMASRLIDRFPLLLEHGTPRQVLELFQQVWLKLNTVFPGRLWVMTMNALQPPEVKKVRLKPLTQDELTVDPLFVLRCDQRVFRCAPIFEIVIRILRAFLAASRVYLSRHIQDNPVLEKTGQISSDMEREELKGALILAQESAAAQILLESCLPTDDDKNEVTQLSNLREVQALVCSSLHQTFISDPHLAKLVHFQGYPSEAIPITVRGIPSMHICLDFIPELLSQPQLSKQLFAIDLASHLCLQYALPKSLSVCRLIINVVTTLFGVLPTDQRELFFSNILPALLRISQAFPPLCEDIASLMVQLGRICASQSSLCPFSFEGCEDLFAEDEKTLNMLKIHKIVATMSSSTTLTQNIKEAFSRLCELAIINNAVY